MIESFKRKYPSLSAILGDIIIASLGLAKKGGLWGTLKRFKTISGEPVFWNGQKGKKAIYYVLDKLHKNHWELYGAKGQPLGSVDFEGKRLKYYTRKDNRKWLEL